MIRRLLAGLLALTAVAIAGFALWMAHVAHAPLRLKQSPTEFRVERGLGMRQIARRITDAGVDIPAWQLTLLARALDRDAAVKAGTYQLDQETTALGLLDKLNRGDVVVVDVGLIEGWTFRQVRAMLAAHSGLRQDSAGLSDAEILKRIGATETAPEGLFLPDTYRSDKGASDLEVLERAYRAMRSALEREWRERDPDLPYRDAYEALIAASLVEKETGVASDRPLIGAVFANRLRRGMLLQTDPSVIYGLGEKFDGNLRKRDLLADGPYNTYTRPGLPPTPVAMPGLASIRATLHPARIDHLYFVARGDGSSVFSRTLDEHNRAVARYQKRRAVP